MKKIIFLILAAAVLSTACIGNPGKKEQTPVSKEKSTEIQLILNLDDLGMHEDYDKSALEVFDAGIIKTGSMMVPAPHFEQMAKEVIKRNIPVGIHITLTNEWQEKHPWSALLPPEEVPSLYNEKGLFWQNELILQEKVNPEDVKKEMRAQIEKALDAGLTLTHMDAHMGCYYNEKLLQIAMDLSVEYKIPIVFAKNWVGYYRSSGISIDSAQFIFIDSYDGIWRVDGQEAYPELRVDAYKNYFSRLRTGTHVMYSHPAKVTPALEKIINDKPIRQGDFNIFTTPETAELLRKLGIQTATYQEIYAARQEL